MTALFVAGARPNFMKIGPLLRACRSREEFEATLVHTGQHYDYDMSSVFFEELLLPKPEYFLGVGSGSHAEQTASIMTAFEKVCIMERPDVVHVVGDVNSTLACSIAAKKLNVRVAHIEAGLRSGDITMPEEINRIVTDSIADYLYVTEASGVRNLRKEGRDEGSVQLVGNLMIDTLRFMLERLEQSDVCSPLTGEYAVLTLHRPSNVDNRTKLEGILQALRSIACETPIVFPAHPRTQKRIQEFGLTSLLDDGEIRMLGPMSYLKFLATWKDSTFVLTDSGGIQEETTVLGVPCLTLRENTETPITVEEGTNILAGTTPDSILSAYSQHRKRLVNPGRVPELWDGYTAERILNHLASAESASGS